MNFVADLVPLVGGCFLQADSNVIHKQFHFGLVDNDGSEKSLAEAVHFVSTWLSHLQHDLVATQGIPNALFFVVAFHVDINEDEVASFHESRDKLLSLSAFPDKRLFDELLGLLLHRYFCKRCFFFESS